MMRRKISSNIFELVIRLLLAAGLGLFQEEVLLPVVALAQPKPPSQTQQEQLLRLARNYEQMDQYARAAEIYQRLWNEEPQNMTYYSGLKQNLILLQRFDAALAVVQKMQNLRPSVNLEADAGDIYYKMKQPEKATAIWQQALQNHSQDPATYQSIAAAMIANRLYDEAIEVYEKGRSVLKNKTLFMLEMINLYRARMDYSNAVSLYLDYLELHPDQYPFVEASITDFANDPEVVPAIEKILVEKSTANKKNLALRHLLAAWYIRTANYQAALQEFSLIDEYFSAQSPKDDKKIGNELFGFAQDALADGAYPYAIQAFTLLLSRYPNSPYELNARFGLANASEQAGDYATAAEKYREIAVSYRQKNPLLVKQSLFRLGEIELERLNHPAAAEGYFGEVLKIPPVQGITFEAMFRLADCYIRQDQLQKADDWLQQLLARHSASEYVQTKAQFKLGQMDFWRGNFDGALKRFAAIQEPAVNLNQEQFGYYLNDALDYVMLIQDNKSHGETLKKYAIASLLVEQKQPARALEYFYQLVQNDSLGPLLAEAWLNIGQLEYQLGHYQSALSAFQALIQKQPQSVHCDLAQKMIGEIYEVGLKDYSKAQQAYEVVLTSYPNSVWLEEVRKRIRGMERGNRVIR
ncbi:MAG: tetratricopeptide repeat protein [candidate division KSB1 bacterium]|nr:tetratricopeptide repeat protein [candidate division KSB1 bacterium]